MINDQKRSLLQTNFETQTTMQDIKEWSSFQQCISKWQENDTISTSYLNSITNLVSRFSTIDRQSKVNGGFGVLEQFEDIKEMLLKQHMERLEKQMKEMRLFL